MKKKWMVRTISAAAGLLLGSAVYAQVVNTGGGGTATSLNVVTLSTGTVLQVNPAVSADRRYVGMSIDTQFSTLNGIDTFVLTAPAGGGAGGGVLGAGGVFVGGNAGAAPLQAVAIRRMPFRPAQTGNVTFVDTDKTLLAARIAKVDLKDLSLKAAVQRLADATKQNVVLGTRGLEQAHADVTSPHDFSLPLGKTPATMKDALLHLIQIAMPETNVVITAEDKVITINSQAQADQTLITRTYYLEDLLANLPRFVAGGTNLDALSPSGPDEDTWQPGHATDMTKPPEPHHAAPPSVKPDPPHANSTDITEVITSTLRPEIWRAHGGKSEIYVVGNKVTIKAPASVHALLDGPKVFNPNKVPSYINYGG